MHRSLIDPADWGADPIVLSDEEAHHLFRVMRAQVGDDVEVFDGRGREARARIIEGVPSDTEARTARRPGLSLVSEVRAAPVPACRLVLLQAIPKGTRMDLIVEKATELGVSAVVPIVTERVVARVDARWARTHCERWQRVALSAVRQCGGSTLPDVFPPAPLAEVLRDAGQYDVLLVGGLGGTALPLGEVVAALKRRSPSSVALLIGPEGDLSPAETAAACEAGGTSVSFGTRVFRVETAALYGLSVLTYELTGS